MCIRDRGTSVYHTDKGEEQGCHQSVREHLQHGTRASCLVHHQDGEQHQAAMADGKMCIRDRGHVGGDGTFQYRTVFDFIAVSVAAVAVIVVVDVYKRQTLKQNNKKS